MSQAIQKEQGKLGQGIILVLLTSSSSSIISANLICLSIIALRTNKLYLF